MAGFSGRPFEERDREGFNYVRSMVYRGGEAISPHENVIPENAIATVVESSGRIVASAIALDLEMLLGETSLRTAGVAAVGVVPEARRSGVGAELMSAAHRQYIERGFAMAALYPFREPWYRKFGYATCGSESTITCPAHRLPQTLAPLSAWQLNPADWRELVPTYEAFAKRHAGMNRRDSMLWNRAIGMETPYTIYAIGNPIEAYVLVRLAGDFWKSIEIREFVYATRRGYLGALNLFSGLAMNKSEVVWNEPADCPFVQEFADQGIKVAQVPRLMWRVLDVKACLSALCGRPDTRFSFRLEDSFLSDNAGEWTVESSRGEVSVHRGGEPGFSLDVQALTQAVLGSPSFSDLLGHGRISALDHDSTHEAEAFFGRRSVYCLDRY